MKKQQQEWTDQAAGKLAGVLLRLQRLFVNKMTRSVATMPARTFKRLLILFCFFSGGFSIYLVMHAIFFPHQHAAQLKIDALHVPAHVDQDTNGHDSAVNRKLYEQLQHYKRAMDSMGERMRPGLLDSIRTLEKIYYQQK
jgi:hypothetical protein